MKNIVDRSKRFLEDESGPTTTEYAVMLTLILLVVLGAISGLGGTVTSVFAATNSAFGGS